MIIGVPKEIKDKEYRVSLHLGGVESLVRAGHEVVIESGAGLGSGFADEEYAQSGARIVASPQEAYAAEMVLKVKEPLPEEYDCLRPGMLLFTYLHLAANEPLTRVLAERQVTAIAYETVQRADGSLPLLTPMSEIAGRMAVQIGAHYLSDPGRERHPPGGCPGRAVRERGDHRGRHSGRQRGAGRAGAGRADHGRRHQPGPAPLSGSGDARQSKHHRV